MTDVPPTIPTTLAESKQAVRRDIRAKWNRFSEMELRALKDRDDLVMQIVAKYGQAETLAQHDVDALLKGRAI